jgi:hypothetical protein
MKRLMMIGSIVSLVGSYGLADTTPPVPSTGTAKPVVKESCQQIDHACANAGFEIGPTTPRGKRLYKDCVQPIIDGKTVSGVTLDPAVIADCQARGANPKKAKLQS